VKKLAMWPGDFSSAAEEFGAKALTRIVVFCRLPENQVQLAM
jgi:hypothetical protein